MNKQIIIENIVNEVFNTYKTQILSESFSSPLLQKIFIENHKQDNRFADKHYNSLNDIVFNNMWRDLSRITDEMIEGVYNNSQEAHVSKQTPFLQFSNGTTVVFNDKIKDLYGDAEKRFNERFNSQAIDKRYKEKYFSKNQAYNDYRDTYKMWNQDIENGDRPYFNGSQETRYNSTPSVVKNSFYNKAKEYYKK